MKIAVISDLHIGRTARARDLQPPAVHADAHEEGEADFLENFYRFVDSFQVSADYLVVPGDITDAATPEEVDHANIVVDGVRQSLNVRRNCVVFVPGNHDVDWSVLRDGDASHPVRQARRYDAFRRSGSIFREANENAEGDLFVEPFSCLWEFPNLVVLGYNSAWHDSPDAHHHHGAATADHIASMREMLMAKGNISNKIKLFVVHHHTDQYHNLFDFYSDYSIIDNSQLIIDLAHEFNFDFLIHGHKHFPQFNSKANNAGHPLCVLGAGSFSRRLVPSMSGYVSNQFHLVEFDGRDPTSSLVRGKVRSWAYVGGGRWQASYHKEKRDYRERVGTGIRHENFFGTYYPPMRLERAMDELFDRLITSRQVLRWQTICQHLPELRYQQTESLLRALENVTSARGLTLVVEWPDLFVFAEGDGDD